MLDCTICICQFYIKEQVVETITNLILAIALFSFLYKNKLHKNNEVETGKKNKNKSQIKHILRLPGTDPEILKRGGGGANLAKCGVLYYYASMIVVAKRGRKKALACIQLSSQQNTVKMKQPS